MDEPDVVWVTHPSFETLDVEEELLVYNYFQSTRKSGGGQIQEHKKVRDDKNEITTLIIKFCDSKCVSQVCAREHRPDVIFSAKSGSVASMDQNLEVKPYPTSATLCSELSEDSESLSLQGGSVAMAAEETAKVEVYEFPEECEIAELIQHFYVEYNAHCRTADDEAWNKETNTFILEFSVSETGRILCQPEQVLYEDEEDEDDATIKVRSFVIPIRKVLITSPKPLTTRMLKSGLKSFGDISSCEQFDKGKMQFVITFDEAEDAERLAKKEKHSLNPTLSIGVQLHDDGSSSHSSGPRASSSFDLGGSATGGNETPSFARVKSMGMSSPDSLGGSGRASPHQLAGQRNYPESTNSLSFSPQPDRKMSSGSYSNVTDQESLGSPRNVSDIDEGPPTYTHVEICKLSDESIAEMYSLLNLHFDEIFGEDCEKTKLQHSYDADKDIFRFDLRPQDLARLVDEKQMLFEDDEDTLLTIKPKETGKVVQVRVVKNPGKARLGKPHLEKCFGNSSRFASTLTVLCLQPARADLEMETCSVASLIVSIGQHKLDNNIVLTAFFPAEDSLGASAEPANNVVLVESTASKNIVKKFMKSTSRGTLTKQLSPGKYLVEYESNEDASKVVEKEFLDCVGSKVKVSFYSPDPEPDGTDGYTADDSSGLVVLVQTKLKLMMLKKFMKSQAQGNLSKLDKYEDQYLLQCETREDADKLLEKGVLEFSGSKITVRQYTPEPAPSSADDDSVKSSEVSTPQHTHIKVSLDSNIPYDEMIALLGLHFNDALGKDWPRTQHEHSYDDVQEVLRFDLPAEDIAKLTNSPQFLDEDDENTRLTIEPCNTGKIVALQSVEKRGGKRLSKTVLKAHFGPSGPFASAFNLIGLKDFQAEMELGSCSVASRVVSMKQHTLNNKMKVKTWFPEDKADSRDSSNSSDDEFDDAVDEPTRNAGPTSAQRQSSSMSTVSNTSISGTCSSLKTLLVSNLVDVDAQTIYFWIKSLINAWPRSVQISGDEAKAIVKIPSDAGVDVAKLRDDPANPDYQLHEETLLVVEVQPTRTIQVICSTSQAGNTVEQVTIEAYFSNSKYTGTAAVEDIRYITAHHNLPAFAITYATAEDVNEVLGRRPYQHGRWTFDVAEYYNEIGVCSRDSLSQYPKVNEEVEEGPRTPIIYVKNVEQSELEMLKLYMSDRRRTEGGEIASWTPQSIRSGLASVGVVYKDPEVAERVYEYYCGHGLTFKKKSLEVELELPWLGKNHDNQKVRISGLNEELDPEKLKFYLSALSNNVVSEIFFNGEQTRAVALFRQTLDYGKLLDQYHNFPLGECPELKIQQEQKVRELLATGNLTKEDIELPLESLLKKKFQRDVEVQAEEFHSGPNVWKITTEPGALPFVLEHRQRIPGCETLTLYTEYLGHQTTSGGTQKKEQSLSDSVSEPLMLHFLLHLPSGYQRLSNHLQSLGLALTKEGAITIRQTFDKKDNRKVLKNWRMLKQTIETFVAKTFSLYRTDTLTQQVFDRVTKRIPKLFTGQQVASDISGGTHNTGNKIAIAGESAVVAALQTKLEEMISKIVSEIQEEKNVIQVSVPNILEYQLEYLKLINFFPAMEKDHKLRSIVSDITKRNVTIHGRPASIDAVQKEMLELLSKLAESKISASRKPLFIKVFKTEFAEKSVKIELLTKGISAVWSLENRTIYVYSASRDVSQKAMDCIDSVVWEAQYPEENDLDDLEMKLLATSVWKDKKAEMQRIYQPLEIVQLADRQGLGFAGLMHHKASMLEEIPYFFDQSVHRVKKFIGNQDRLLFLSKFRKDIFADLEREHRVKIVRSPENSEIGISGTKDDIANFDRALKKEHDLILKEMHVIENEAMVQYINGEHDFLEAVGLKTSCLVVHHKEEVIEEPAIMLTTQHAAVKDDKSYTSNYSVTLPSGTVCEVRKGDLTSISCDAIVNAANGDLQHFGGLAASIVQKGGQIIQQECANYIRRNGKLMEGQVMTSSSGSLPCKKIIHAVGPRWRNGFAQEERTLFTCVDSCFDELVKYQLQSIAIPPISTGIFGYPLKKAVKTIVDAVANRESQKDELPPLIIFTDNKDNSLKLFEEELITRYGQGQSSPSVASSQAKQPTPLQQTQPAQPPQPARPVTAGKYTINGKTLTVLNRVNIEIKKGDLSVSQEDSLVNSVGKQLDLTTGKVAQAIAAKAGPELQAACTALAPISPGEVKETGGFNLPCKKVLHCSCPEFKGPQSLQSLTEIVIECLTQAAANGHQSIAFPALGTGNLRYREDAVAQYMIEATTEYVARNPNSSIKTVRIIIFHLDTRTWKGFEAELEVLALAATATTSAAPSAAASAPTGTTPKRNLLPLDRSVTAEPADSGFTVIQPQTTRKMTSGLLKDALKGCVKVNNTTIRVIQGDITTHRANVLVNSTDGMLSIQGQVSKALMNKAGPTTYNEVKALALTAAVDGMWISSAGYLDADFIFHVNASSCKSTNGWSKLIANCLKNCDRKEIRSIAFPAIGTGVMGVPPKEMAKTILESAVKYLDNHAQSQIETIDVVIFIPAMVQEFVQSMSNAVKKKDSLWSRFTGSISQWFTGAFVGGSSDHDESYRSVRHGGASSDAGSESLSGSGDGVLKLDIYGVTREQIQECRRELESKLDRAIETHMWSDRRSYTEDRENIGKLSQAQITKLHFEAEKLHVKIYVDQRIFNIKIVGLNKDVHSMAEIVAAELKNIEREMAEKKEEILIAKAIQWVYEDEVGKWTNFHPSINKGLEEAFNTKCEDYVYSTAEGKVSIDLSMMVAVDPAGVKFKVQRNNLSAPQAASRVKPPTTWIAPLETYGEYALVPATAEYKQVEDNFIKTLGSGGTAVLEIRRVQNILLYDHYITLRKNVAERLNKKENEVETTPLWHGTSEDTVSKITSGIFDRGMAGKNATLLGRGNYFARKSAYSAQKTYSPPNPATGHKYIIQARVITGEWTNGAQDIKAAPYKGANQLEQYESVVDNPANPSIFVVFRDASAYPEYIIKFQ